MVKYLTQYTDYMTNLKIPVKDMAVSREFLEPFKWDSIPVLKGKMGNCVGFLTKCLK